MTDTTTEAVDRLIQGDMKELVLSEGVSTGPEDTQAVYRAVAMLRALAAERDALRAQNIELQSALAETEALEIQHGAVIESLRAQLIAAQAQAKTSRDALEDITGVGFDMPATLELSDAEWSRRRASIMQQIARAALIHPDDLT